jgi:hypothetical protein
MISFSADYLEQSLHFVEFEQRQGHPTVTKFAAAIAGSNYNILHTPSES